MSSVQDPHQWLEPENSVAGCGWILRDPVGKARGGAVDWAPLAEDLRRRHTALGLDPAEHTPGVVLASS